jgi:hypothetical protein
MGGRLWQISVVKLQKPNVTAHESAQVVALKMSVVGYSNVINFDSSIATAHQAIEPFPSPPSLLMPKPKQPLTPLALPVPTSPPPVAKASPPSKTSLLREFGFLKFLVTLFAVAAPILYAMGYLTSGGYVLEIGLEPELYQRSADMYVAYGLTALSSLFVKKLDIKVWVAIVVGLTLFIVVVLCALYYLFRTFLFPSTRFARFANKVNQATDTPLMEVIGQAALLGLALVAAPALPILILTLILFPFHEHGREMARANLKEAMTSDACSTGVTRTENAMRCVSLSSGKESDPVTKGFILLSSEKAIAIYDPARKQVRSFHPKDGMVIAVDYERVSR